jgi:hypothetical protein
LFFLIELLSPTRFKDFQLRPFVVFTGGEDRQPSPVFAVFLRAFTVVRIT